MMRKKAILAALIAVLMLTASACGTATPVVTQAPSAVTSPDASTPAPATEKPVSEVSIKMFTPFNPDVEGKYYFDVVSVAAQKLGYKVEMERADGETYKTRIRVALQGNELPDIFYTWGATYSDPFLAAGALYPVEQAVADSGYKYGDAYLAKRADGHAYAIPVDSFQGYGMFYNKNVLAKLNMEVPATWDDLLKLVDACNSNKIYAIGLGNKDRWEGDLLYNSFVMMEDINAFRDAEAGKTGYNTAPFLEAAKKIKTLVDKGAFQNGYMQAPSSDEVLEMLKADQIALFFIGPWLIPAMSSDELGTKMGYTTLPKIGATDPAVSSCTASTDAGLAISVSSPVREEALKFALEYSKLINDEAVKVGKVAYMQTDVKPPEGRHEIFVNYAKQMENLKNAQLWWFSAIDAKRGEPMRDLSHKFFAGKLEPQEFVDELDKIMSQR